MRTCYGQWYPHPPWHLKAAFGPGKEALPVFLKFPFQSLFILLLLRLAKKFFFQLAIISFLGLFLGHNWHFFLETVIKSNQMKLLFCTSRAPERWSFHTVTPHVKLHEQHHLWTPGATAATVTLGTWSWGPVPDLRRHPGICIPNKASTDTGKKYWPGKQDTEVWGAVLCPAGHTTLGKSLHVSWSQLSYLHTGVSRRWSLRSLPTLNSSGLWNIYWVPTRIWRSQKIQSKPAGNLL